MPISVPYEELDGLSEERTRDRFTATRRFKVAWSDRLQARDDLLNWPGDEYPHSPATAWCTRVSTVPFGESGQGIDDGGGKRIDFTHAIVTAFYESASTSLAQRPDSGTGSPDERISEDMFGEVQGVPLTKHKLYWDIGNPRLINAEEAPSLMIYRATYTLTRHHLTALPTGMEALIGKCNAQPWQTKLIGRTFAPETLLFVAPRVNVVSDLAGTKKFTVSYSFTYNPNEWNRFPKPSDDGNVYFDPMYRRVGGDYVRFKPITPANLSVL